MIKRVLLIFAGAFLILFSAAAVMGHIGDNPANILKSVGYRSDGKSAARPLPREGEKLRYLLKYMSVIPLGTVEIEVGKIESYKRHRVYPVSARGNTPAFISGLIKAEGTVKSYVDVDKMYPWRYEEDTRAEGHRPSSKIVLYDQTANIMEHKGIKRKIPPGTQDPVSALFFLRWQDYGKDGEIICTVNSNKENYTLRTGFLNTMEIAIDDRTCELILLRSRLRSPKKYSKSEAGIITYITGDASRLPILMKIRTKFGPLTVRLTEIKETAEKIPF